MNSTDPSKEVPGRFGDGGHAEPTNVLIVEDDESVALTLQGILEEEGYQVALAAAVPEALAHIESQRFAAGLIDLRLEGGDGLDVLTRLKERWPSAVGIVLTGFGSLEIAVQAMRAGADDFLLKPTDIAELKASIARAIHWRAQMDKRADELERANERLIAEVAERRNREDTLRQSEAQLWQSQALAHLGSWQWDAQRNVVTRSAELYRIYGLTPEELGVQWNSFLSGVHPDDRVFVRGVFDEALQSGKSFELDYRIVRPDDNIRILHAVGEVRTDNNGRTVGLFGTAQDVTELRAVERRLDALEDLNRLKEEFIATASHDLKAPLTSVQGYTQLLLRRTRAASPDLEQVIKGLAVIESQTAAMTRLLDHLLDASRIQAGVLELRTAPCDISESLERVLARLDPVERERVNVELPDAPLAGEWEPQRIEQVLTNLLANALKYSSAAQHVNVTVERRAGEIEVSVRDSGMGIPPEEQSRLFERFHRTPQAQASGLPGTGLGLYICAGILAAHGGRIWAESAGADHGSTFRFTLPTQRHHIATAEQDPEGSAC